MARPFENKKPQMKAPRVTPLEGAFTYGFAIRVKTSKISTNPDFLECSALPM
ncbi:MAG: hypothetical protein O8C65_04345 [Candidatus Methanoperedens sp.]|nr:hypothetical protein [Candidatus Methanoperedens sp.]